MNAETQYQAASRKLMWVIIATAVVDFALLFAGFLGYMYLVERIPQELADAAFVGLFFVGFLVIIPAILLAVKVGKLEAQFWQELAQRFGHTYVHKPYFQEFALIFQQGRGKKTGHGFSGTLLDRPFRFFQYQYTIGSGKNKKTYNYCVAEVAFAGTFPHIYLNNTKNRDLSDLKALFLHRVALPAALADSFKLHAPEQYEIEALQIFTPNVLAHIHDSRWEHDIELVDQKLYIFREQPIKTSQAIEEEVTRISKLVELLAPTLNRARLEQVGDYTTAL